jgi:hypothetical protein
MQVRRMAGRWVVPLVLLLAAAGVSTSAGGSAGAAPPPAADRGAPGVWTKISTGTGGISYEASLHRTADGVLHVVYPKAVGTGAQIGHVAIDANGSLALQNDVLPSAWSTVENSPIVIGDAGGGVRTVFGGQQSAETPGYWSDGRMYAATAPEPGTPWALPMVAVGQSHEAYGSYGTAATTLEDGTPVAAFPLNSDITWHVGTDEAAPDETFGVGNCCAYHLAMVRDGNDVWIAWYQNGSSAANNGTFVKKILPSVGPTLKAPQSSVGASSLATGRVALVARTGGGVFAAYCLGYPTCNNIGLWKVGSSNVVKVPASRYAGFMSLSPGPSGRIWIAWSDNIPKVKAVRTNIAGTRVGAGRVVGMPPGTDAVYNIAVNGATARGDVVINVGNAFWHTQVAAGLTLKASPGSWKHGKAKVVTFTVTDAGDSVSGAKVTVAGKKCLSASSGRCRITVPKNTRAGQLVAKATKSGYGAGSTRLKVT